MHSTVIVDISMVLTFFKIAKRLDPNCFPTIKKQCLCVMEVLAIAVMIITLQYINVSNQQVIYLKLIQCYMSSI